MNEIVTSLYKRNYDVWGMPQEYKNLKIYPLKIKDTSYIDLFYFLMAYPKNHIPDKQIIKMSYLKYLLLIVKKFLKDENQSFEDSLIKFLKYVLQKENISLEFGQKIDIEDALDSICIYLNVDDQVFTEEDFGNIREIILEQNGLSIEYIEEYNPELEKRASMLYKNNDISFADEIFTFCSLVNKTIKEIEDYTIHQFKIHMEKMIVLKEYNLYRPLEASGQITLKSGEIKHYLFHSQKSSRYGNLLVDTDKFFKENDFLKPQ